MTEIGKGLKVKRIPDSDSTHLSKEFVGEEQILRIPICKVCRKPFSEGEVQVVCDVCKHYCHDEHSARYHMTVYDHLCLVKELKVDKKSYLVLHAIAHERSKGQIKGVLKLQSDELDATIMELKAAGLVREKLFSTGITYKASEVLPLLEEVYSSEKDVQTQTAALGVPSSGHMLKIPGIPVTSGRVMFGILAVGALVIMIFIQSAVNSALRFMRAPAELIVIVWILILLGTCYVIYIMKGWFDL